MILALQAFQSSQSSRSSKIKTKKNKETTATGRISVYSQCIYHCTCFDTELVKITAEMTIPTLFYNFTGSQKKCTRSCCNYCLGIMFQNKNMIESRVRMLHSIVGSRLWEVTQPQVTFIFLSVTFLSGPKTSAFRGTNESITSLGTLPGYAWYSSIIYLKLSQLKIMRHNAML